MLNRFLNHSFLGHQENSVKAKQQKDNYDYLGDADKKVIV